MKLCKDCYPDPDTRKAIRSGELKLKPREAKYPGPRCYTHHHEVKRTRKAARHGTYVERTYNLTAQQYEQLYVAQNGTCAICHRATGATRKLSVDHDHACCNGPTSCGSCVRGLLCRPCNDMLGHARDSVEMFYRAIAYLNAEYVTW